MIISILFYFASLSLYLFKATPSRKIPRFIFSTLFLISFLLYGFYIIIDQITGNGISNAVIYLLKFGVSGAGFYQYKLYIGSSIVLVIIGLFGFYKLFSHRKVAHKFSKFYMSALVSIFILSFFLNPGTAILKEIIPKNIENVEIKVDSGFYDKFSNPFIVQKNEKKNLVYIYAEGLERTYFDETIFPGLVDNLKKIESESISYTNIEQDSFSSHTIGGIVASQCGFPLIAYSHTNSMNGMDLFLSSAICLSDLLKKQKFYLSYYGGARLKFAGKGNFLKTHKFDEVKGFDELIPDTINSEYHNGWGLYDDTLLDLAFDHFTEIASKKENFAFFTLTLDTHHPEGMISSSCKDMIYGDGENPILNSVFCSDYLISNFIKKIRSSGLDKDTIIVIASDHLAMNNTAYELLENADRKNLFIVNFPDKKLGSINSNPGLTFDLGPTILSHLGFDSEIGLGRNLDIVQRSIKERAELVNYTENNSEYFIQFWNFPKIKNFIAIDIKKEKLIIDNREMMIPALLEIDKNMQTKIKFDFDLPYEELLLENIDKSAYHSFLIDKCENMGYESLNNYCVMESFDNKSKTSEENVDLFIPITKLNQMNL